MSAVRKPKMSKTQQVLAAMLTENVGRSMLDSGGTPKFKDGKYAGSEHGYGRGFERNQGRNFLKEPEVFFSVNENGFDLQANVFHWLDSRLTYDAAMQARFNRFAARKDNEDKHYLELMEEFPLYLREKGLHVTGLYGDEREAWSATNTYNHDSLLSQVIQYVYFEIDTGKQSGCYVALQIHGGADVRGGYTAPKIFAVGDDGTDIMKDGDADLNGYRPKPDKDQPLLPGFQKFADKVPAGCYWHTDDAGANWYLVNDSEWGVKEYEKRKLGYYPISHDRADIGQGVIVIDQKANKLYCPVSGYELQAMIM